MRIRELHVACRNTGDAHSTKLDFTVLAILGEYIPCSRLLPNLERLTCHDLYSNAPYFIQPSLKALTVYDLGDFAEELAGKIKQSGYNIRELELLDDYTHYEDKDSVKPIYNIIGALDHLTSLTRLGGPLADNLMKQLASSLVLTRLTVQLSKTDHPRILSQNHFAALQTLKIITTGGRKHWVAPFLHSVSPLSLIDLHVEYEDEAIRLDHLSRDRLRLNEDHLRSVFAAMAHLTSLERISLTVDPHAIATGGVVTASMLGPILALEHLRSLHLSDIQLSLSPSEEEQLERLNIETVTTEKRSKEAVPLKIMEYWAQTNRWRRREALREFYRSRNRT